MCTVDGPPSSLTTSPFTPAFAVAARSSTSTLTVAADLVVPVAMRVTGSAPAFAGAEPRVTVAEPAGQAGAFTENGFPVVRFGFCGVFPAVPGTETSFCATGRTGSLSGRGGCASALYGVAISTATVATDAHSGVSLLRRLIMSQSAPHPAYRALICDSGNAPAYARTSSTEPVKKSPVPKRWRPMSNTPVDAHIRPE